MAAWAMGRDLENHSPADPLLSIKPEFPLSTSRPTDNVHLTATECNCQSGLQRQVLPRATEATIFASPENPKAPR